MSHELDNVDVLIEGAANAYPREACGLVYGNHAYELKNVAKHGTGFFIMDMEEQRKYWELHGRPTGVWHSHPNGDPNPSDADLYYHPKGMRMLIVARGKVHDHGIPG